MANDITTHVSSLLSKIDDLIEMQRSLLDMSDSVTPENYSSFTHLVFHHGHSLIDAWSNFRGVVHTDLLPLVADVKNVRLSNHGK